MKKVIKKNNITDLFWSIFLALLGAAFLIYYIFNASVDVPTTDYIRVINTYIDNPYDITRVLQPDFIVRCPITYLFRIINVKFFRYSVFFDKIVSILSLSFIFGIITYYERKKIKNNILKNIMSILIFIVCFSLNSWEMILNGTGYPIFLFFVFVVLIYELFENYLYTHKSQMFYPILLLIFCSCILTGSDYTVAFLINLIIFSIIYVFIAGKKRFIEKKLLLFILFSIVILVIYYISSHSGEMVLYVYDGMKDIKLTDVLFYEILFVIKFFLKSLAGIVIGTETFQYAISYGTIDERIILIIGILFLIIIIFTLVLIVFKQIYKKDLFSVMCVFHSGISLALIFLARYAFLSDTYGMSSRYQVQLMFLPIGIIIILFIYIDGLIANNKFFNNKIKMILPLLFILFIVHGRILTTIDEMHKASVRKMCYERARTIGHNVRRYKNTSKTDELLKTTFEYNKGTDLIKNAFEILRKNKLNIFYE